MFCDKFNIGKLPPISRMLLELLSFIVGDGLVGTNKEEDLLINTLVGILEVDDCVVDGIVRDGIGLILD